MSWIRRSPFGRDEDPLQHMLALLSAEAEASGASLTDQDKKILSNSYSPDIPQDFREKVTVLIQRLYEAESVDEFERDPKSFGSSVEWAGDTQYPTLVALAEEVARERTVDYGPKLHGWRHVMDRILLVGTALLVIIVWMMILFTIESLLHIK